MQITIKMIFAGLLLAVTAMQVSAAATVTIGDCTLAPDGEITLAIMVNGFENYGTGKIDLTYNPSVVHVTGVAGSSDSTVVSHNNDNIAGVTSITAWNEGGVTGDIVFANVVLKAVGSSGESCPLSLEVNKLADTSFNVIHTDQNNGIFKIISADADHESTQSSNGHSSSDLTPPLPGVTNTDTEFGSDSEPAGTHDNSISTDSSDKSDDPEQFKSPPSSTENHDTEPDQRANMIPGFGIISACLFLLICAYNMKQR
jgi:hypothetical protein